MSTLVILLLLYQLDCCRATCSVDNCMVEKCTNNVCNQCTKGYYLHNSNYCQKCYYRNCECTSYYECIACLPGWHGQDCNIKCPEGCIDSSCQRRSNACVLGCEAGYYNQLDNICKPCADHCFSCTTQNQCSSCDTGYWGVQCQFQCVGCYQTGCNQEETCDYGCNPGYFATLTDSRFACTACPSHCKTCIGNFECSACKESYWGDICDKSCDGCLGYCDKSSGCSKCKFGWYGLPACSLSCSKNCKNRVCNGINGQCSYGCNDGYFGDQCESQCYELCKTCISKYNCDSCPNGSFGRTCGNQCLTQCNSCSNANSCRSCKPNFFNKHGSNRCECSHSMCAGVSGGVCLSCKDLAWYPVSSYCCICSTNCMNRLCNADGSCSECPNKRYGNLCQHYCDSSCKQNLCFRDGSCIECYSGFFGTNCKRYCNSENAKCIECVGDESSQFVCTKCAAGYYPQSGRCIRCNDGCHNTQCNSSTGVCIHGCRSGFFGSKCDVTCQVRDCKNCREKDENICQTCYTGFYNYNGSLCKECPRKCKSSECEVNAATCLSGCVDGWSGLRCDIKCPFSCVKCDRYNNTFCNSCVNGYYGEKCELTCSKTCQMRNDSHICIQSNGHCQLGCLVGYWNSKCAIPCSDGCLGNSCNEITGECLDGCKTAYYGISCLKQCSLFCLKDLANASTARTCDERNGSCLAGCETGWYGESCQFGCSQNCKDSLCDRLNGTCRFGCSNGFSGLTCNQATKSASQGSNETIAVGAGTGAAIAILAIAVTLVVVFIVRRRRRSSKLDDNNSRNNVVECSQAKSNEQGHLYRNIDEIRSLRLEEDRYDTSNIVYANTTVRMSDVSRDEEQTNQSYETVRNVDEDLFKQEILIVEEPTLQQDAHVESLDDTYYNVDGKRVTVHNLQEYVRKKSHFELLEEFEKIPKGLLKDYKDAKKSDNAVKNKYRSIYPYDDSRVVLYDGGSDYMNASYISGNNKPKEYIASSGPFKKAYDTTPDFWRMVWQEKCENIVMLTNPMEREERKCEVYWPEPGASKHFGDLHVTCLTEDRYSDFTIRTLTASQNSESLNIRHLHFTAWPDKGVPHDVTSMIEFRQKVRSLHKNKDCPMLVHCSAGIGRTGTFIALDMLTCEGESRGSVDIFCCVACLRSQRCNMVQTADQYEYLHHAVLHSLTFDCRSIAAIDFQQHYARLIKEKSGVRPIDGQFQQLQAIVDEIQDDVRDEINRNKALRDKNRDGADIPEDSYRIKLHASRKPGASDYINAVFINGLRAREKFIVAQTPLPTTIVDFLTLIHQTKCSRVVMMEEADIKNETLGVYWPADNQTSKHGIFKVSRKEAKSTRFYTSKTLSVVYHGPEGEEEHEVHFFIFTNWPRDNLVPKSPNSLLQFVKDVDTINRRGGNSPILIHCMTGSERSCLYCAVSNLVEKMEIEQEVSVVNTLRQIKARRLLAFPTIEQYKFCHEALISYLQTFETYSNFALQDSEA